MSKVAPAPAPEAEEPEKAPFLLRILGLPPLPPELQVPDDVFELLRCANLTSDRRLPHMPWKQLAMQIHPVRRAILHRHLRQ
jgi:hypothetical protein